jgi:hypothetical protein
MAVASSCIDGLAWQGYVTKHGTIAEAFGGRVGLQTNEEIRPELRPEYAADSLAKCLRSCHYAAQ